MMPYGLSPSEYADAAERGRHLTALKMREDPEAKERGEKAMGKEFCKRRFPEAYIKDFTEN